MIHVEHHTKTRPNTNLCYTFCGRLVHKGYALDLQHVVIISWDALGMHDSDMICPECSHSKELGMLLLRYIDEDAVYEDNEVRICEDEEEDEAEKLLESYRYPIQGFLEDEQ